MTPEPEVYGPMEGGITRERVKLYTTMSVSVCHVFHLTDLLMELGRDFVP